MAWSDCATVDNREAQVGYTTLVVVVVSVLRDAAENSPNRGTRELNKRAPDFFPEAAAAAVFFLFCFNTIRQEAAAAAAKEDEALIYLPHRRA